MHLVLTSFPGLSHMSTSQMSCLPSSSSLGLILGEYQPNIDSYHSHKYSDIWNSTTYWGQFTQIKEMNVWWGCGYTFHQIFKWLFASLLSPQLWSIVIRKKKYPFSFLTEDIQITDILDLFRCDQKIIGGVIGLWGIISQWSGLFIYFLAVLGIKFRASHVLGKHSTTVLHPSLNDWILRYEFGLAFTLLVILIHMHSEMCAVISHNPSAFLNWGLISGSF